MYAPQIELIPLDIPQPGFRQFISSWLITWKEHAILIDPGPAKSIPTILEALKTRHIEKLTGVLLTHIHIDHAGGIGDLCELIQVDWIQCHQKAHRHLVDPSRLWNSSVEVLGDLTHHYGPIKSVDEALLRHDCTIRLENLSIVVVDTPGHAPHHQCFFIHDHLFAGEAAGVFLNSSAGTYVRPATPPKFIYQEYTESIKRLLSHPALPHTMCYAHYGKKEGTKALLTAAYNQIDLWCHIVQQSIEKDDKSIIKELLTHDALFSPYTELDEDIKQREDSFIGNTIKGVRGYIRNKER